MNLAPSGPIKGAPRTVPIRGALDGSSSNAAAQRAALARLDPCARICGISRHDVDHFHRESRERPLRRAA